MVMFQCELRRGSATTVGWIEERGAKEGAAVELYADDKQLWRVSKVHRPGMSAEALRAKQARDRGSLPSILA